MNTLKNLLFILFFMFGTGFSQLIAQCNPDVTPPVAVCDESLIITLPETGLYDLHYAEIDEGSYDNCSINLTHSIQIGELEPAENLLIDCSYLGGHTITNIVIDESGNQSQCWATLWVNDPNNSCQSITLSGRVFFDNNENCSYDNGESGMSEWEVEISNLDNGTVFRTTPDNEGYYEIDLFFNPNFANVQLEVRLPSVPGMVTTCGSVLTYTVSEGGPDITANFPLKLNKDCPLLTVDIATDRLRFCSEATYRVNYCNLSALTIEDTYVEVTLNEDLTYTGSSIPLTASNNDVYTFNLGDLASTECATFTINVAVTCESLAFQTLCVAAHIFPDAICNDPEPFWSGASIEAEADCEQDLVKFRLKNAGSSVMANELNFRIVEDVVMYMQDTFYLPAGEEKLVQMPANGSTWRIEAEQEPGHPGSYRPVAWLEGCGGINQPGLVNLFPTNDTDPFVSVFCMQISAAFDPNDKQGFPLGLGEDGLIEPNQPLDYMIRFQNTGNDTAFLVTIVDTLTENLDWASIRPGTSSHPYQFEATPEGIVRFIFDPIMLPDSNVNEAGSHGFVRFHINQKADLPLGTVIENSAGIYFDFNEPVITNRTKHTLGRDFIVTANKNPIMPNLAVNIAPNPFTHVVNFDLEGISIGQGRLYLFDTTGKRIRALDFSESSFQLSGQNLAPGIYYFEIQADGRWLSSGKLMVQ
ncbi:MAG: hypothetical protein DHS20C18_47110 [Saprospiraceae bacterium]|nr:MAG: hypothetical protein DHS20C18_47110 [Saprospiraceae bacterium]